MTLCRLQRTEIDDMNGKTFAVCVSLAWGVAVVSSSAPAAAIAMTDWTNPGTSYASCSSSWVYHPSPGGFCPDDEGYNQYEVWYIEKIKFVSSACNSGGCSQQANTSVDFIYPAGRKTAAYVQNCGVLQIYELGSCSC
jgi:hypothetical protein